MNNDGGDLPDIWPYQRIESTFWKHLDPVVELLNNDIIPAIIQAMEDLEKVCREITESFTTAQEQQAQRTHQELVTLPLDHTHAHVSHTSTKPPARTRIYRRRTP